jgi:hypothetical protein
VDAIASRLYAVIYALDGTPEEFVKLRAEYHGRPGKLRYKWRLGVRVVEREIRGPACR